MKKLLAHLICAVLTLSLIAGCSSGSSGTSPAPAESKDPGGAEKITLTFMGWEASPLETESVTKGIASFEAAYPNIKVNYTPTPGEYAAKLLTMMAGEAAPDVFFMGSGDYNSFITRGVLLDLTDRFYEDLSDDDFIQSSLSIMKQNNKIYGVSSCTVSPVLYYNKDIFDAASEPYPPSRTEEAWTFDEFREAAKRLTKKNGDKVEIYGVYGLESNDCDIFLSSLASRGASLLSPDMKKVACNTPEVADMLRQIRDVRMVDGSSPTSSTLENIGMSSAQMLQTGKVAMLVAGSWSLQELAQMNFSVGSGPLPKFEVPVTTGQAHVHSAWAKTKYPDEAWEFIKFLSSEEYQIDLVKAGLWMPNRNSLYTEEGMKRWYDPEVHGDTFLEYADYYRDAVASELAVLGNTEFSTMKNEEIDNIFKNEKDIPECLNNMEKRGNEILGK